MNLYDLVKQIMETKPYTRNSDKGLIWEVLRSKGLLTTIGGRYGDVTVLMHDDFLDSPTFESITRARRKVQEVHPELQATESVKEKRSELASGHPIDMFENI